MSTFWLEFSALRVWDYPIGFRRDYPINSSPGAAQVGLSYRFRFGRRMGYGAILSIPGRKQARTGFGIPGRRPPGQQVWGYPIGFEVHRARRRCGTILSDSPGLSYRLQFLCPHGVGLSYRVHRDYPIDSVGLSDWFSWTILLPCPPGPLPAVGLTGSPSYCHTFIYFIAVPGSATPSRSR